MLMRRRRVSEVLPLRFLFCLWFLVLLVWRWGWRCRADSVACWERCLYIARLRCLLLSGLRVPTTTTTSKSTGSAFRITRPARSSLLSFPHFPFLLSFFTNGSTITRPIPRLIQTLTDHASPSQLTTSRLALTALAPLTASPATISRSGCPSLRLWVLLGS